MADDLSCFHCGLPVTQESGNHRLLIKGQLRDFCCSGCAMVCQVIHESGLDNFYQRVQSAELSPPTISGQNLEQYDLPEIQADFVSRRGNLSEATLLVEGIHCAACIWLIERALQPMQGVESAEVNLAHHRLRLRWDPSKILLSTILKRLNAIGYGAVPYDPERAEGAVRKQNKAMLYRMAFAGFGAANMMWITISLYAGELSASKIDLDHKHFFWWVSLVLATPVLLYSGWPFLKGAINGVLQRRPTMDLPISIGVWATYLYSVWVMARGAGEVYFDIVTTFLFIILIGRYLEGASRRNASSASGRMMEMQPRSATLLDAGIPRLVDIRTLKLADQVLIRPGEKIPVDGRVDDGLSQVDESLLTGEARLIHKERGDKVVAGAINGNGSLVVTVEQLGRDTALAKIIHLVEEAQGSKAPIQRTTDRVVPWFVMATLTLSAITFLYWNNVADFDTALMAGVSVLIITCPCAFGMATPMSVVVSVGHAAANGVLIRNGAALENLAAATHVVFDKTGTLTEGRMTVSIVRAIDGSGFEELDVLRTAAQVEAGSEHSVAKAIVSHAIAEGAVDGAVTNSELTAVPGRGVVAELDGKQVAIGSSHYMRELGVSIPGLLHEERERLESEMGLVVFVAIESVLVGMIGLQDKIRQGAREVVQSLYARGMNVTLLTGDSRAAAERVASELGGDMNVIAEVLPAQKDGVIAALQAQGACVVMVGDGVNDAPALVRANVGVAMGTGTDVSMECADIVLISNQLDRIGFAVDLSHQTIRTIRQNIAIALGYNLVLIPTAMSAALTPIFASIAMPISSLLVIGNAIMIRKRCKSNKTKRGH